MHTPGPGWGVDAAIPATVFGVMAAGALGAWARFLAGLAMQRLSTAFPWGTLCINVSGCALIAGTAGLAERMPGLAPFLDRDVATGFIGAFTTFSTFTVETLQLLRTRPWAAALYAAGSISAGAGGIALGRWLAGQPF